jgi:hypothetical protein
VAAATAIELNGNFLGQVQPPDRVNNCVLAATRLHSNRPRWNTNRLVTEQWFKRLENDTVINVELDIHRKSTLIIIVTGLDLLCLTF